MGAQSRPIAQSPLLLISFVAGVVFVPSSACSVMWIIKKSSVSVFQAKARREALDSHTEDLRVWRKVILENTEGHYSETQFINPFVLFSSVSDDDPSRRRDSLAHYDNRCGCHYGHLHLSAADHAKHALFDPFLLS